MADKQVNEKEEKQVDEKDEKELEKHDEKIEDRDALSSVVWAAVLIWAGLVFLAANTGYLDRVLSGGFLARYLPKGMEAFEPSLWGLIMLGAGVIVFVEALVRVLVPQFNRRVGGTFILAAVFTAVGLGNLFQRWDVIWPMALIVVGAGVLLGGLLRKRK